MPQLNPWINDARADIGKFHDGPDVPMLAMRIAGHFPDLEPYCRLANRDTEWCGIMIAEWLSRHDIRAPFTPPGNNVGSFMFVDSWADIGWGTHIPIGQEQPGDIAVFRSPHHVTMVAGNGEYIGGNQSNGVTETSFNRSGLRAIIRPPAAGEVAQPRNAKPQQPDSAPVPLNPKLSNFRKCLPLLLEHEGGNDDDPRDPGGRTSRGILQREWDVWRVSHPGLPSDVFQAPQDQVEAIYKQKYWDPLRCDELPSGVDYAVFDYGVNSGISRAAKVLQRLVGAGVDGEIGPQTIGATLGVDPKTLVGQICDERLAFLQGLSTFSTFGRGWTRRVSDVRAAAETMAASPKPRPSDQAPSRDQPTPGQHPLLMLLLMLLLKDNKMADGTGAPGPGLGDLSKVLLPLLLQSALTGKQIDIAQLLTGMLTGQLPAQQPALPPPQPTDPIALLLPLLIERLTGKTGLSAAPSGSATTSDAAPKESTAPIIQKPSVQLSAAGLAGTSILQAIGTIGTPFGMGSQPTVAGTLATLIPLLTGLFGATNGFGALLNVGRVLLGAVARNAK
jgi:lysozyme family protein